jgi:hypothetical protein
MLFSLAEVERELSHKACQNTRKAMFHSLSLKELSGGVCGQLSMRFYAEWNTERNVEA